MKQGERDGSRGLARFGFLRRGEPLLLGPGSIHVAHTPFEKLAKKELLEAVELYVRVGRQLLG